MILLLACRLTGAPGPTVTPAPTATVLPTPVDQPLATPERLPLPRLPAPLYFIDPDDDQVWRLERDGATLSRMTDEPAPVTDFDVSQLDSALVYVTGNDLVWLGPLGEARILLVDGPPLPPVVDLDGANDPAQVRGRIATPRWSDDSGAIAYVMGGVHWMTPAGISIQTVITNDPLPEAGASPDAPAIVYDEVLGWSPGGQRLLLQYHTYPLTGDRDFEVVAKDLSLIGGDRGFVGIACMTCDFAWGPEGRVLYGAGRALAGRAPGGLRRFDASNGAMTTLVAGQAGDATMLAAHPFVDEGWIYLFVTMVTGSPARPYAMGMARVDLRGGGEVVPVREDLQIMQAAVWAPDGSGVILVEAGEGETGRLIWVPVDGSPTVPLPVVSTRRVRWGASL